MESSLCYATQPSEKSYGGRFKPNAIISITRGGWIPARVTSGFLEIYDPATIEV